MVMRIPIRVVENTPDGMGRTVPMIAVIEADGVRHEAPADEDTLSAADSIRAGLVEDIEE